jgi:hypothetical protein
VLGAEQQDGLEYQLQPLALPILERAGEECTPVLRPDERLTVGRLITAELTQLEEELTESGADE